MLHRDMLREIKRKGNDGPDRIVIASLSVEQLAEIQREFRATPEWAAFLEYCQFVTAGVPVPSPAPFLDHHDRLIPKGELIDVPAPFVEKFDTVLRDIVARRTPYSVALLWDVIDVLYEDEGANPLP